jgi:hypothetical protein
VASIEDERIPLLPDVPVAKQEDFHEKTMLAIFPCLIHHGEEVQTEIPQDVEGPPVLLTKRAPEEEVKGCLLSASRAEHTSVVIPLQLTLFPSENVPHITIKRPLSCLSI